jgi:hypothetical protein
MASETGRETRIARLNAFLGDIVRIGCLRVRASPPVLPAGLQTDAC